MIPEELKLTDSGLTPMQAEPSFDFGSLDRTNNTPRLVGGSASLADTISNISKPSLSAKLAPIKFDWDRNNTDRYLNSKYYKQIGFNPQRDNESRYGYAQSWGDTLNNAIKGMYQLGKVGFWDGWKGWSRASDALKNWDFKGLLGDEESQMALDKARNDIMNKYAIFSTPESDATFFNRKTFGNLLQQSGFTFGVLTQTATEMIITKAIEALLFAPTGGASGVVAGVTAAKEISTVGRALKSFADVFRGSRAFTKANATKALLELSNKSLEGVKLSEKIWKTLDRAIPLVGDAREFGFALKAGVRPDTWNGVRTLGSIGIGGIKRAASEANMVLSESRMEAAGTYSALKDKLYWEYFDKHGEVPAEKQKEFEDIAQKAGYRNFKSNAVVIGVSNRIMFDNMFKSFKLGKFLREEEGAASKILQVSGKLKSGEVGKRAFAKSSLRTIGLVPQIASQFGTKKALWEASKSIIRFGSKWEITEGLQENIQDISNDYFSNYYHDLYSSQYNPDIIPDSSKTLREAIDTQISMQGLKTFMSGALMGFITAGPSKVISTVAERIGSTSESRKAKKDFNDSVRQHVENLNTFYTTGAANFLSPVIRNFKIQADASGIMEAAIQNDDRFTFENIKEKALTELVHTSIQMGTHEALISHLEHLRDYMSKEEFEQAFQGFDFTDENKTSAKDYIDKIVDSIKSYINISDTYHSVYDKITNPKFFQPGTIQREQAEFTKIAVDNAIHIIASNQYAHDKAKQRMKQIFSGISSIQSMGNSLATTFTILGSEENTKREILTLQNEISSLNNAPDSSEKTKRLKELNEQLGHLVVWNSTKDAFSDNDQDNDKIANNMMKSLKSYIQSRNKSEGVNVIINDNDVNDVFGKITDYIKLNKKAQQHTEAINVLTNPKVYSRFLSRHLRAASAISYMNMMDQFNNAEPGFIIKNKDIYNRIRELQEIENPTDEEKREFQALAVRLKEAFDSYTPQDRKDFIEKAKQIVLTKKFEELHPELSAEFKRLTNELIQIEDSKGEDSDEYNETLDKLDILFLGILRAISNDIINGENYDELSTTEEREKKNDKEEVKEASTQTKIDKIPNTNYEIKADGAYFNDEKIETKEDQTIQQAIEQDIQKRKEAEIRNTRDGKSPHTNEALVISLYDKQLKEVQNFFKEEKPDIIDLKKKQDLLDRISKASTKDLQRIVFEDLGNDPLAQDTDIVKAIADRIEELDSEEESQSELNLDESYKKAEESEAEKIKADKLDFKTDTIFSSTGIETLNAETTEKDPDPTKIRFYNALKKIRFTVKSSSEYETKEFLPGRFGIFLKWINPMTMFIEHVNGKAQLNSLARQVLQQDTINNIDNGSYPIFTIKNNDGTYKRGFADSSVLILTDSKGKPYLFDQNGDFSNNGKLIYTVSREVGFHNGRYFAERPSDGSNQVQTPYELAAKIARKQQLDAKQFNDLVDAIDKQQQKEFKQIYELRKSFIKDKSQVILLPVNTITKGIVDSLDVPQEISKLNDPNLQFIPGSIDSDTTPGAVYFINPIDKKPVLVVRPYISAEIAKLIDHLIFDQNDIPIDELLDFLRTMVYTKSKSLWFADKTINGKRTIVPQIYNEKTKKMISVGNDKTQRESFIRFLLRKPMNISIKKLNTNFTNYKLVDGKVQSETLLYNTFITDNYLTFLPKLNVEPLNSYIKFKTSSLFETEGDILNPNIAPTDSQDKTDSDDIKAKKADINIGKIPNTEYEVKADGVYFEGKKLDNPKNLSHKELITEDIRRRQEEELKGENYRTTEKSELYQNQDGDYFKIEYTKDGKYKLISSDENGRTLSVLDSYDNSVPFDKVIDGGLIKVKDLEFTNRIVDKINAKYDAELAALGKSNNSQLSDSEKSIIKEFRDRTGIKEDVVSDNDLLRNLAEQSFNITGGKRNTNAGNTDLYKNTIEQAGSKELVDLAREKFPESVLLEDQSTPESDIKNVPSGETKPSEPTQSGKNVDDKIDLLKRKTVDNKATPEQIKRAKEWWESSDLKDYIPLEVLMNVVNSNALGTFTESGIKLFNGANFTDLYHEAWHGFSQLYLTKDQKIKLYNETKGLKSSFVSYTGKSVNFSNASYLEIEEFLAEDFRRYRLSNGTFVANQRVERNTIFRKILNFLRRLFNGITKGDWLLQSDRINRIKSLYDNLSNNNLTQYSPSVTNMMFGKLNKGIASLSNAESKLITDSIDYLFLNEMDVINKRLAELGRPLATITSLFDNKPFRNSLIDSIKKTIIEKIKTATPYQATILQTAVDNFSETLKYYAKRSSFLQSFDKARLKVDENGNVEFEVDETEDTPGKGRNNTFDRSGNDKSVDEDLADEVKYLISTLTQRENGKDVLNALGFPKLIPYDKVRHRLTNMFAGVSDESSMFKTMIENSVVYPELAQLAIRLGDPSDYEGNDSKFNLWMKFRQGFSRPIQPIMEQLLSLNDDGTISVRLSRAKPNLEKVLADFSSNFMFDLPSENPYITVKDGENVLNIAKLIDDVGEIYINKRDKSEGTRVRENVDIDKLFKALGIKFTKNDITQDEIDKLVQDRKILSRILNGLFVLDKNGIDINNPLAQLKTPIVGIFNGEQSNVEAILSIQAKNSSDYSNLSVINAEGKREYEQSLDSMISQRFSDLNDHVKYPTLQDVIADPTMALFDKTKNPYMIGSVFLDRMFFPDGTRKKDNNTGEYVKMEVVNLNGIKITGIQTGSEGLKVGSVNDNSMFMFGFNNVLLNGYFPMLQHASKSTYLSLKVSKPSVESRNLYYGLGMFHFRTYDYNFVKDLLIAELTTIGWINEGIEKNLKGYSERAKSFRLMDTLLSDELKTKLYKIVEKGVPDNMEDQVNMLRPALQESFEVYFKSLANQHRERLTPSMIDNSLINSAKIMIKSTSLDYPVIQNGKFNDIWYKIKSLNSSKNRIEDTRNYLADIIGYKDMSFMNENNINKVLQSKNIPELKGNLKPFISNSKFSELENSEFINILNNAYTFNSFVHNVELIRTVYGDTAFYNLEKDELHKRIGAAAAFKSTTAQSSGAGKYINDKGRLTARNLGIDEKRYDGTMDVRIYKDKKLKSDLYNSYFDKYFEYFKKRGLTDAKAKELAERELEPYTKIKESDAWGAMSLDSFMIMHRLLGNSSEALETAYMRAAKGEELTSEEFNLFLGVSKFQYFGPLASNGDTSVNRSYTGKLYAPAFHKFSIMPLIPSVIKGTELERIHEDMMRKGHDYFTFESGSKVANVGEPNMFFKDDDYNKRDAYTGDFTINRVFTKFLGEQVRMEPKWKKEVVFSTQTRKDILSGIYNEGVPIDFKGSKADWDKLSESRKIKKSKLHQKAQKFISDVDNLSKVLKEELLKEAKITEEDDRYRIDDFEPIVKILLKEFNRKDLPDDIIEFVDIIEDGKLKNQLDTSPYAQKIEGIIQGIINNRLIRQKVNGEPLVQVPSTGFNKVGFRNATEDEQLKYGSDLLSYVPGKTPDDPTLAMEVKVALSGDYLHLLNLNHKDGKPIKVEYSKQDQDKLDELRNIAWKTMSQKRAIDTEIHTITSKYMTQSRDRLNEMLRDKNFRKTYKNHLTLVGERIPVQGLNSMEFMQIKEFLPMELGNAIILPTELSAKSGGDYDVDKLNIRKPNFDSKGNVIKKVYNTIEEAVAIFDTKKDEFDKAFAQRREDYRAYRSIIDSLYTERNFIRSIKDKELKAIKNFIEIAKIERNYYLNEVKDILNDLNYTNQVNMNSAERSASDLMDKIFGTDNLSDAEELDHRLTDYYRKDKELSEKYQEKSEIVTWYNNYVRELSGKSQNLKGEQLGKTLDSTEKLRKLQEELQEARENKHNVRKSMENELVFSMKSLLEDPSNFIQLITPNSVKDLTEIANNLRNRNTEYNPNVNIITGREEKRISPTTLISPIYNIYQYLVNNEGKNALSITATDVPFNILLNSVGAYMNKTYIYETFSGKKIKKEVYLPFRHNKNSDGNISLSHEYDNKGKHRISRIIEQIMNGHVDVEKDPWIFNINAGVTAIPTVLYMVQAGVPIADISYFMTQPVITRYTNQLRAKSDIYSKTVDPAKYEFFKSNVQLEILNDILGTDFNSVDKVKAFMHDETKDLSESYMSDLFGNQLSDTNKTKEQNALYLLQYMDMENIANAITSIKSSLNYDTKTFAGAIMSRDSIKKFETVVKQGLFPESVLNDLKNKTILKSFQVQNLINDVQEQLFPLRNSEIVNNFILSKKKDLGLNINKFERFAYTFKNDLVQRIFQKVLYDMGVKTGGWFKGANTVSKQLENIKKKYPSLLSEYYMINNLLPDILKRDRKGNNIDDSQRIHSIKLVESNLTTDLINDYRDQFIRLIDESVLKVPNKEQNHEITQFFKRLATFGFLQSGLNKSNISFNEIIPSSIIMTIFGDRVKELSDQLMTLEGLNEFYSKFKRENQAIFWFKEYVPELRTTMYLPVKNPTPYRGKNYIYDRERIATEPVQYSPTSGINFQEEQTTGYRNRTIKNASADATIALATDFESAGERLTKTSVQNQKKLYIGIDANNLEVSDDRVNKIVAALNSKDAKTLNIAGNGIYTMKGKYTQQQVDDFTFNLLKAIVENPNLKNKIESVRTGGQTGFDEAGAKAGIKLGIPTTILAPKGWTFRNVEGKDISNEKLFKDRFDKQQHQSEQKHTQQNSINIYAGTNENVELSNFAIRPFTTNVETPSGEKTFNFKSVEQGFHFYKAMVANNPIIAKKILETTDGGKLRNLTNRTNLPMTPQQTKEWDDQSKSVMLNLMFDSFDQNPEAAKKLLDTGNATITHTQDRTRWKTDFPDVIMTVRDMLREEQQPIQQSAREYTPENITSLKENEVFVFGSNTEGRHGKGAALTARQKFGAVYGQAKGLQGQSYAIVTKDLSKGEKSRSLGLIQSDINDFLEFAASNPDKKFYVTKLGSSLAGYSTDQIKQLFKNIYDKFNKNGLDGIPENVILPIEYEVRDEHFNQSKKEETPLFKETTVTIKKDEKSNWTLTVKEDGTVINKNNNKPLDEQKDARLINKARLKSKFYNYQIIEASNGVKYAVTDEGRVFTLAQTTMGNEINKSAGIYKELIEKAGNFVKSDESDIDLTLPPFDPDNIDEDNSRKDCEGGITL